MIVVEHPHLPPGSCAVTRTSTGPFIDTLVDVESLPPYGRVYLSFDAISTMAQKLGMLPAESVARIEAERDEARAEVAAVRAELDALLSVKAVLDSYAPPEDPMSRMPTPTELRHADEAVEIEQELAPPDDTPEGEPLDDTLAALLVIEPLAVEVLQAFYGAPVTSLADVLELDPPPDTVKAVHEWVEEAGHPVVAAVRRAVAVAVEQAKSEGDQRKGILDLAPEVPA